MIVVKEGYELDTPIELTAYDVIYQFLKKHKMLASGGQKVFYTQDQWRERDELYGNEAVLVICHDGGSHARAFNWSYEDYKMIEALRVELEKVGLYVEQCTCWYSAVYRI